MLSSSAGGSLDVGAISQAFLTFALEDGGLGLPTCTSGFGIVGDDYIVWEPYENNSRWWIGPEDESAPFFPLDEVEKAIAIPRTDIGRTTDRDDSTVPTIVPETRQNTCREPTPANSIDL